MAVAATVGPRSPLEKTKKNPKKREEKKDPCLRKAFIIPRRKWLTCNCLTCFTLTIINIKKNSVQHWKLDYSEEIKKKNASLHRRLGRVSLGVLTLPRNWTNFCNWSERILKERERAFKFEWPDGRNSEENEVAARADGSCRAGGEGRNVIIRNVLEHRLREISIGSHWIAT